LAGTVAASNNSFIALGFIFYKYKGIKINIK